MKKFTPTKLIGRHVCGILFDCKSKKYKASPKQFRITAEMYELNKPVEVYLNNKTVGHRLSELFYTKRSALVECKRRNLRDKKAKIYQK